MTFRTLLSLSSLRDKTNETSPINAKQSSFFRSHKLNSTIFSRFLRAILRSFCRQKQRKAYGKWFDFPCHYTNSNPHDVLRAIKVVKEDEKYIVVGFRNLQQNVQNMKRANTISTTTDDLTIKVKNKFTSSNAEKTNGFISLMSEIFTQTPPRNGGQARPSHGKAATSSGPSNSI